MLRRTFLVTAVVSIVGFAAGCGVAPPPASIAPSGIKDPLVTLSASPNYADVCAQPVLDDAGPCEREALAAIDRARRDEGLQPLLVPADLGQLPVDEQLMIVINQERVARGLPAIEGTAAALDQLAAHDANQEVTPSGVVDGGSVTGTWLGGASNALDADFQWLYQADAGSACAHNPRGSCWADRHALLANPPGTGTLTLGAAAVVQDTSSSEGGSSWALALGRDRTGAPISDSTTTGSAEAAMTPLERLPVTDAVSGIADPPKNVGPDPDYPERCRQSGIDDSAGCIHATLEAVDHARALEGVPPMLLPNGFESDSIASQLFIVINLERVDRGLPPLVGRTSSLDDDAMVGARHANDPPLPGSWAILADSEWAGGSVNGLDADYGLMYDDGYGSGNLDCHRALGPGCWGHRQGILDDYGQGGTLLMGTAFDPTGDNNAGDERGTSMAAVMAMSTEPVPELVESWYQVLAADPGERARLAHQSTSGSSQS